MCSSDDRLGFANEHSLQVHAHVLFVDKTGNIWYKNLTVRKLHWTCDPEPPWNVGQVLFSQLNQKSYSRYRPASAISCLRLSFICNSRSFVEDSHIVAHHETLVPSHWYRRSQYRKSLSRHLTVCLVHRYSLCRLPSHTGIPSACGQYKKRCVINSQPSWQTGGEGDNVYMRLSVATHRTRCGFLDRYAYACLPSCNCLQFPFPTHSSDALALCFVYGIVEP